MNQQGVPPSSTAFDPELIKTYCNAVFRYLEGTVPVRILSETGTSQQAPQQAFPDVENLTGVLCVRAGSAANKGSGVYVVPCTVEPGQSARAENIRQTCVIVVDLDKGDIGSKRAHAVRYLGAPSLDVASGGITEAGHQKSHLYWRLTEAACGSDLERVRVLRETLALKLGGDTSFKTLAQPIRVAGTVHGKNGVKALVRIIEACDLEYDLADFEEAVREMPALDAPPNRNSISQVGKTGAGARDLAVRKIRAGALDETTRFEALSKVIGHWLRNARLGVCSLNDAWTAVQDHNAAMIIPPWDDKKLQREFHALLRRDIDAKGAMPPAMPRCQDQASAPTNSEDAIADRFAVQHGADWKHVAQWGAWFRWTGQFWIRDTTGGARELARMICRAAASECERPTEARRIASDRTIAACLRIAASDPRIAAQTSDWDTHSMLLNTPSGIIDLETGEIVPHDPSLLLTQITAASSSGDCPLWHAFLDEITGGNEALQTYLHRLAGYCLTGSTREQNFAFLHGDGANGKSVFLSTIAHVLGD